MTVLLLIGLCLVPTLALIGLAYALGAIIAHCDKNTRAREEAAS